MLHPTLLLLVPNTQGGSLTLEQHKLSLIIAAIFMTAITISVLASRVVDRGFQCRLGQTKCHKIVICIFSAKHAVLGSKSKDGLAQHHINVS
jgi:hypothetical protein